MGQAPENSNADGGWVGHFRGADPPLPVAEKLWTALGLVASFDLGCPRWSRRPSRPSQAGRRCVGVVFSRPAAQPRDCPMRNPL